MGFLFFLFYTHHKAQISGGACVFPLVTDSDADGYSFSYRLIPIRKIRGGVLLGCPHGRRILLIAIGEGGGVL